jgi:hypothetical protein
MALRLILLACITLATGTQAQGVDRRYADWNLPRWARETLYNTDFQQRYDFFYDLNPYYQRGDFDGDGRLDLAIQIVTKSTRKRGIAIIHYADRSVHVLGAGQPLGNGGDDFSWLGVWRVESPEHLRQRLGPTREALYVAKLESASGWIVWDGRQYMWIQGAD